MQRRWFVSCVKSVAGRSPTYFMMGEDNGRLVFGTASGGLMAECAEYAECEEDGRIVQAGRDDALGITVLEAVEDLCTELVSNRTYTTGNRSVDSITGKMWDSIGSAARLLVRKLAYSSAVIIRFHNDADGSGGALCLFAALTDACTRMGNANANIIWTMQRGVVYGVQDAALDATVAGGYSSVEKPLLVLVDFGTTAESNRGIEALRGRFDILWLDHHPIAEGFEGARHSLYINPWNFAGDSNYTAGLLASALSNAFSTADTRTYEQASLIGDYSSYADTGNRAAQETSMLLDFITSDLEAVYGPSKSNVTPQEIQAVLSNLARRKELLDYANIRLEEAIERGMSAAKLHVTPGAFVYVLDFEDVREEGTRYPLPGRFSSKLLSRLSGMDMRRVVVVVYVGAYVLMRADKELCAELNLLDVIAALKQMHGDLVENGGGHRCAAAVKLRDKEHGKQLAASAVRSIKELIGHGTGAQDSAQG